MWGTPLFGRQVDELGRFILTHVGNTMICSGMGNYRAVHPHACGEHNYADLKS